jgi:hypothetical protein
VSGARSRRTSGPTTGRQRVEPRQHQSPSPTDTQPLEPVGSPPNYLIQPLLALAPHPSPFAISARRLALPLPRLNRYLPYCLHSRCRRPASRHPASRLGWPVQVYLAGRGRGVQRKAVDPPSSEAGPGSGKRPRGGVAARSPIGRTPRDEQPETNRARRRRSEHIECLAAAPRVKRESASRPNSSVLLYERQQCQMPALSSCSSLPHSP